MLNHSFFEYNEADTSDIEIVSQYRRDTVTIQDITYASPKGGRVPAYLIIPDGKGPFAALIFLHWGEGDRNEFVDEAIVLAELGVVSLCLDGPFRRPAKLQAPMPLKTAARDLGLQIITDVRCGVDLLSSRPDIDVERIGFVGHSYGATNGGVIAGVEKRIKSYVLMAGYASTTDAYNNSTHPMISKSREKMPQAEWENYLHLIEPLDAIHYIGQAAPASILFQFAHQDEFVSEEQAQLFLARASDPKELLWYDSSHELNAQARIDRAKWLCQELGLGKLPVTVRAKLDW